MKPEIVCGKHFHMTFFLVHHAAIQDTSRTDEVVRCERMLTEASNGDYSQLPLFLNHSFDEVSILKCYGMKEKFYHIFMSTAPLIITYIQCRQICFINV